MDSDPGHSARRTLSLGAFTKLFKAQNTLNNRLGKIVPLPPELQGSGFPILEALLHKGPLRQCELSQKILRTTGNISQALDKLERRGLLKRNPGPDRRTYLIDLTPEGRSLIESYFPLMSEGIERVFSALSFQELEVLSQLAKKLGTSPEGEAGTP